MPRDARTPRPRAPRISAVESLEGRALMSAGVAGRGAMLAAQVGDLGHSGGHSHTAHRAPRILGHATIDLRKAAATPRGGPSAVAPTAYTPAQIRHAYGVDQLTGLTGAGQTIAIVDAYDDPAIASDLKAFDAQFNLPNLAFQKSVPVTGTPQYNPGWATEIALDVEWAHAIAPGAKILLVEARTSSYSDLLSAVDSAVAQGASQVSMSWGGGESGSQSIYAFHFAHPGVTFLDASGDGGAGASYPAASPNVTDVGGTTLTLSSTNARASETAWSGSGGGLSGYQLKPAYQNGVLAGTKRGIPDVSWDADPNTGVLVLDSSSGGGWYRVGGTSAGAPQWAGLMALTNQGRAAAKKAPLFSTNSALYALAGGTSYTNTRGDFLDITTGNTGNPATAGYDLATGLGSPVANKLVPDLINA